MPDVKIFVCNAHLKHSFLFHNLQLKKADLIFLASVTELTKLDSGIGDDANSS